jgi:hypothetical protein
MSRDRGARGYFAFEGDAVSVFLHTGPDGGMADIFIDTQLVQTIDLYSPEPGRFTLTFDALPPSSDPVLGRRHHVRIDVNGSLNPAASDNWVRLDAAMAESTAELPDGRLEDDSPLRATIIANPDEYEDTARILGQIRLIRQWMADHGQRDKPLLNTEYGVLLSESAGFDYPRVRRFMLSTFDLFYRSPEIIDPAIGMPADGGRMIQQWLWFILSSWERYNAQTHTSLMSPVDRQMLPLGEAYGNYVRDLVSEYSDLEAADLQVTAHWALFAGEASTLRAVGRIRNLGNQETAPFQVRLSSTGAPAQQWEAPGLSPRYGGNDTMTVDHTWQVTATNALTVALTADSAGQVNEPCEPNNALAVTLAAAAAPDLALTSLTMTPPVPTGAATTLRLTAEVANLTSAGAADDQIVVRFWDGIPEAGAVLLDTQVITRGVNANLTPVIYDWQGFASGEHTVVVEVAAAAEETNLANNRRQTHFFVPYGQRFNYFPRVFRS